MKKKASFVSILRRIAVSNYVIWILMVFSVWPFLFIIQMFIILCEGIADIFADIRNADWELPVSYSKYKEVKGRMIKRKD